MANDDQTKNVKTFSQNLYDEIKPRSPTTSDITKGQPSVKEKKSKKSKEVPSTSQTEEQRRNQSPGAVSVFPEENESHGSNNEGADHVEINKKGGQLMTLLSFNDDFCEESHKDMAKFEKMLDKAEKENEIIQVLVNPNVKKEIDKLKRKFNAELLELREENTALKEQVAHLITEKAEDDRMRDGMFRQIQRYLPIVKADEQRAEIERQAEETFEGNIHGSL